MRLPDGRGTCCHWGSPGGERAALRSPQLSGRLPTSERRVRADKARASPGFNAGPIEGWRGRAPLSADLRAGVNTTPFCSCCDGAALADDGAMKKSPKMRHPKMPLPYANALPVSSLLRKWSLRGAGCWRIPKAHPVSQPCRRGRARRFPYVSCVQSARKHALLTRALQAGPWASGTSAQLGIGESSMRNLEGCRQPMSHSRGPPIFGGPTTRTAWGRSPL